MTDTTNTPTPEMDAFERDIIACIPEELHQLQAYARKGREIETRLAAAEAELAALKSRALGAVAPSPVVMPEEAREAVIEAVAEALGDAYDCTRVWDAWSYGTMGPDDFVSVAGQADRLAEIADAAIAALTGQGKGGRI